MKAYTLDKSVLSCCSNVCPGGEQQLHVRLKSGLFVFNYLADKDKVNLERF